MVSTSLLSRILEGASAQHRSLPRDALIDKLWRPLGQVGSFKNQFLLRSPWKPESRGTTRGILSSSRKRSDHSGLGGHTWFILLKFLAELISRI
ncbi:hypothetical protein V6N11_032580 [Hibiscus sabdariffa]|uniref:Uncharacterized protein n=1 Tax=Hibiscus sabdariffa TaxID=183260 RepID=A0ABR2T1V3_9ROSI